MKAGKARRAKHFYEFGPFSIDLAKRRLLRDGEPVPLTPKAFDTLLVLVQHSGQALDKDDLMQAVWPDTAVEENNLTQNISALRKALGDSRNENRYIATIPGWGYRFVASVSERWDEGAELILQERTRSHIIIEEEETNGHANADCGLRIADSTLPGTKSDNHSLISKIASRKANSVIVLAVLAIGIAGIAFGLYRFTSRNPSENRRAVVSPQMEITRLTQTRNIGDAAISPDGKYIVYVAREAGRESLWLRQVDAAGSQQIVPPAEVRYYGLTLAHDGNYIYYVRSEKGTLITSLYRMPALGGVPTRLVVDLHGFVTLSPDGGRVAFTRSYQSQGESALLVANADGREERRLATRPLSDPFSYPAWSPDGKVIACAAGSGELYGSHMSVIAVRVEDGAERPITSQKWQWVGRLAWLADSSGLVIVARQEVKDNKLWHLSFPGGEARRITNDANRYRDVSLTADSSTLVSVQTEVIANIWTLPDGDVSRARQITPGASNYDHPRWTPDGRIVYASQATGNMDIWIMEADGMGQKQLTASAGSNWTPAVSGDGRYIIFVSDRTGAFHIWRMDIDGGNPVQLTSGSGEKFPDVSPDGKWVVYTSPNDWTLWRVPVDGGEAAQLTGNLSWPSYPAVSPDGKWIACIYRDEQQPPRYRIAVIPFAGGQPVKMFDVPPAVAQTLEVWWTPDGNALTYIVDREGVSNVWSQPLDGGKPGRLTDFKSDRIRALDWSRDGRLLCVRGGWTGDAVLISNFR